MTAVRARDLRANIKELGFENGMVVTVELLLEELVGLRQAVVSFMQVQEQLIDLVSDIIVVSDAMKHRIDAAKKIANGEHDA